jgi:hypothetical protein
MPVILRRRHRQNRLVWSLGMAQLRMQIKNDAEMGKAENDAPNEGNGARREEGGGLGPG